ncbi:MAG: enoyl-ACP reductase FabI [Candidatus Carbobacillus altaicus]|uniref:Enoyl-[acyl-carrier-protein] reductase [NADH] n=1 Tax=Candidatus Carbonibacillus altaicus TaxID=2163959 RepID=A0A2R6Y1A2_9BACL|nr:enoyl-ACP reductase FabI [Candidatus Carbobacillus altaicus]PTQ56415.1 MAG: Enoyl-[acyl-carrier-protein] reductase [NADH] [Candidatus Carbobacillus altaicus]
MLDLTGRTVVVMGVANKRSIAWGIAEKLDRAGAQLVFTYQGERLKDSVMELAATLNNKDSLFYALDVTSDEDIEGLRTFLEKEGVTVHGLVHAVAFAKKEELEGTFLNTSRDGYLLAQNISVYSLVAVARSLEPLMTEGGSILTMTYLGGERVVMNYNVMGVAKAALESAVRYLANDLGPKDIRVNAISAGPIRTVSAKGVSGFNDILHTIESRAPLRRNVTQEDVGGVALFLMSDLSRGVTGDVIYVDSGYHILGV